jgi:hypothetical protein
MGRLPLLKSFPEKVLHDINALLYYTPQKFGQDFVPSQVENVTMRKLY